MTVERKFRHVVTLPLVDGVHQTLVAFFSTSEHGTWRTDPDAPSTSFNLHLMHGNWRRAWFGLSSTLTPGVCDRDAMGVKRAETRPMKLKISIRPSPDDIRLSLTYSVFSGMSNNPDHVVFWTDRIANETKELSEYLRKCYGVAEPLPYDRDV